MNKLNRGKSSSPELAATGRTHVCGESVASLRGVSCPSSDMYFSDTSEALSRDSDVSAKVTYDLLFPLSSDGGLAGEEETAESVDGISGSSIFCSLYGYRAMAKVNSIGKNPPK